MKIVLLLIILAFVYSFNNTINTSGGIDCFAYYTECLNINEKDFCLKTFSDCVRNTH